MQKRVLHCIILLSCGLKIYILNSISARVPYFLDFWNNTIRGIRFFIYFYLMLLCRFRQWRRKRQQPGASPFADFLLFFPSEVKWFFTRNFSHKILYPTLNLKRASKSPQGSYPMQKMQKSHSGYLPKIFKNVFEIDPRENFCVLLDFLVDFLAPGRPNFPPKGNCSSVNSMGNRKDRSLPKTTNFNWIIKPIAHPGFWRKFFFYRKISELLR